MRWNTSRIDLMSRLEPSLSSSLFSHCSRHCRRLQLSGSLPPTDTTDDLKSIIDLQSIDFKLPPPRDLPPEERASLLSESITRIWDGAEEMRVSSLDPGASAAPAESVGGAMDMWMLLLVRMITRVAEPPTSLSGEEPVAVDGEDPMTGTEDDEQGKRMEVFYETQDRLRQTLCDYIMADFTSRHVSWSWLYSALTVYIESD